jgi:hypothetical protein
MIRIGSPTKKLIAFLRNVYNKTIGRLRSFTLTDIDTDTSMLITCQHNGIDLSISNNMNVDLGNAVLTSLDIARTSDLSSTSIVSPFQEKSVENTLISNINIGINTAIEYKHSVLSLIRVHSGNLVKVIIKDIGRIIATGYMYTTENIFYYWHVVFTTLINGFVKSRLLSLTDDDSIMTIKIDKEYIKYYG